jgi:hypothetical protein
LLRLVGAPSQEAGVEPRKHYETTAT